MMESENEILLKTNKRKIEITLQGKKAFTFKCTECGNCCQGPGEVYFEEEDFENIANYLELNDSEKKTLYKRLIQKKENTYLVHSAKTACIFLTRKNECRVYPVRPLQCRTFPFWPSTFKSANDLEAVKNDCPGTMSDEQGSLEYSPAQTSRKVNLTQKKFLENQDDKKGLFML